MMRLAVGAAGVGKTALLRALVAESVGVGWRVVVLDLNGEWSAPIPAVTTVTAAPAAVATALRDPGPRVVVVSLPRTLGPDAIVTTLETVAAAVVAAGRTVLVLSEAGTWLPLHRTPSPSVYSLLTRWRHLGCGLFFDFQRFAQVSTEARDAARTMYCFAASNSHDGEHYRRLGGPALVAATAECAARFHRHEPGWHVVVSPNAPKATTYTPVRRPLLA